MLPQDFEVLLKKYFEIEHTNRVDAEAGAMGVAFYLRCKKVTTDSKE